MIILHFFNQFLPKNYNLENFDNIIKKFEEKEIKKEEIKEIKKEEIEKNGKEEIEKN